MAWVAVDKDGQEVVCKTEPTRFKHIEPKADKWWQPQSSFHRMELPKGSIEKLIGRKLTWEDEPVELKELKESESLAGKKEIQDMYEKDFPSDEYTYYVGFQNDELEIRWYRIREDDEFENYDACVAIRNDQVAEFEKPMSSEEIENFLVNIKEIVEKLDWAKSIRGTDGFLEDIRNVCERYSDGSEMDG